jgi:hypothetical protein
MAHTTRQSTKGDGLTLTEAELDTLREIVNDWIGEELVTPPYPSEIMALLEKLGVSANVLVQGARPAKRGTKGTAMPAAPQVDEADAGGTPPPRPNLG